MKLTCSDNGMSCYKLEETSQLPFLPYVIVKPKSELKPISYMFDKLRDKFKSTDWRPLRSSSSGIKKHAVGVSKGKDGRVYNRNIDTGRFDKSAFKKAKDSWRKRELETPTIESTVTQTLFEKTRCWQDSNNTIDNPEIQTGLRLYGCGAIDRGESFKLCK